MYACVFIYLLMYVCMVPFVRLLISKMTSRKQRIRKVEEKLTLQFLLPQIVLCMHVCMYACTYVS